MKSALLIAAVSAISIQDAPPFYNAPTWHEGMASAAGLAQSSLLQASACMKAGGISDVSCGPTNIELFATGMNGDEDLGQDITMKGEKFHYQQNALIQLNADPPAAAAAAPAAAAAAPAAAAAAPVPAPEKVSILDAKIAKTHTSFYGQK